MNLLMASGLPLALDPTMDILIAKHRTTSHTDGRRLCDTQKWNSSTAGMVWTTNEIAPRRRIAWTRQA